MLRPRWNNVEIMSYQRWSNVETTLCNVEKRLHRLSVKLIYFVSMWDTDVVSMLCNVENPTSDFVSYSTLDRRCFHGNPQCQNNVDPTLKCWLCSIYEKVNSLEYSACNFTNKMKPVGIFQGLCWNIPNTRFDEILLVVAASENSSEISSFE